MSKSDFHKSFKLEGRSFDTSKSLIDFCEKRHPQIVDFLRNWYDEKMFMIVKTSGSTGVPKNIELRKSHMVNSARATGDFLQLSSGISALLCLPTAYIAGKMMMIRALVLGWELDIVSPDLRPLNSLKKNYDFAAMVPLQLAHSIKDLYRLKILIVGGAPIDAKLLEEINQLPTLIYETYGMTETITHIALKKLNTKAVNAEQLSNAFELLPNVKIQQKGGKLIIDAPKISDAIIETNDLVRLDSPNSFVWLGRADSVINTGGIKVFPEQIEQKIGILISDRFFVFARPDTQLGSRLILILEKEELMDEEAENLLFQIRELTSISRYECPKEIWSIPTFLETPTGKLNRPATFEKLKLG